MARLLDFSEQLLTFSFCIAFLWPISGGFSLWTDWCFNATSCQQKECRDAHVSVPLPFHCEAIPAHCHRGENLLRPNKSIEVFYNDAAVIYSQSTVFCSSAMLTTSGFNNWRIEFNAIQSIYAVLLWRNGPLDEPEKLNVKIVRNVSSHLRESTDCKYSIQYDNYHYFYCYSQEKFTSDYRLGIEGHTVEIKGSFYIDDSMDFTRSVKVYSYPVRLCAPPEKYDNQQVYPRTDYYFPGQEVEYECEGDDSKMLGNSTRKCKENGLWTSRVPICVRVAKVRPIRYSLAYYNSTATKIRNSYLPAKDRFQALMFVPQQVVTLELEDEHCLSEVSVSYYSEPSQRSNVTVTLASDVMLSIDNNLHGESRIIHYRPADGDVTFVCTKEIVIERHRDKITSQFVSAELILDVFGTGYRNSTYRCMSFPTLGSYDFGSSPDRFAEENETFDLRCSEGYEPDSDYSPKGPTAIT